MLHERAAERMRCFLKATILYQNRSSTMDCVVRNISPLGAKLILDQALSIPAEFELDISQRGAVYRCALKWRHGNEIGIAFQKNGATAVGEMASPHASDDYQVNDVPALNAENAKLRQTILDLRQQLDEVRRRME